MLVEIQTTSDPSRTVILLHASDNVAIARVPLLAGQRVEVAGQTVNVTNPVPAGHKVAIKPIAQGAPGLRYGEVIGFATQAIAPGEHVHTHNLGFSDLDLPATYAPQPPAVTRTTESFLGYARADGRTGTRNHIAVVAASNCAAHAVTLIEEAFRNVRLPSNVDGVVAFPHGDGCGQSSGADTRLLQRTLEGVLDHPNVAAALVIGLGCEVNQIDHYLGEASGERAKSLIGLTLQESGGTRAVVSQAQAEIRRLIDETTASQRKETPASAITLGLNCGGSDSFSGITANPALGFCSDLLVAQGGAAVLAETTEIFGAEHLLLRRARTPETGQKLLALIDWYKRYLNQFGGNFNENPSPGNKAGGLTNILEKSLGAVAKGGTSTLEEVYDFAERVNKPGFSFMNTPGYDPVSLAGLAAGGCNLIAFTTGRGSAIGFPTIPVLKIASNSATFRRMLDNMDIDAGRIAEGDETIESVGREIFAALLRIASGEKTKAELQGHHEFVPWRIGPVL
jgi:altronate hydrolase